MARPDMVHPGASQDDITRGTGHLAHAQAGCRRSVVRSQQLQSARRTPGLEAVQAAKPGMKAGEGLAPCAQGASGKGAAVLLREARLQAVRTFKQQRAATAGDDLVVEDDGVEGTVRSRKSIVMPARLGHPPCAGCVPRWTDQEQVLAQRPAPPSASQQLVEGAPAARVRWRGRQRSAPVMSAQTRRCSRRRECRAGRHDAARAPPRSARAEAGHQRQGMHVGCVPRRGGGSRAARLGRADEECQMANADASQHESIPRLIPALCTAPAHPCGIAGAQRLFRLASAPGRTSRPW